MTRIRTDIRLVSWVGKFSQGQNESDTDPVEWNIVAIAYYVDDAAAAPRGRRLRFFRLALKWHYSIGRRAAGPVFHSGRHGRRAHDEVGNTCSGRRRN